ncbi:MAG: tyrosine-protein phosphatase [Anaerolineales bacterium]|jgi:protein-tyrosine phosphatase
MQNLTHLPFGLPGDIYRSPMPFGAFDLGATTLEEYKTVGVNVIVMLTSPEEDLTRTGQNLEDLYHKEGFQVIRLPIIDFEVPEEVTSLDSALKETIARAREGKNVAIHCYAGRGRTGMFAALLARRILGLAGEEAIIWARQFFPAIETDEQAQVVMDDQGGS